MAQRYGSSRRGLTVGGVVIGAGTMIGALVAVLFGAIMWWVIASNATPDTQITVVTFQVLDSHEVTTDVNVVVADDVTGTVTCTVAAGAVDGGNVGETTFTPVQGRQTITIRTDRKATTVDDKGCRVED